MWTIGRLHVLYLLESLLLLDEKNSLGLHFLLLLSKLVKLGFQSSSFERSSEQAAIMIVLCLFLSRLNVQLLALFVEPIKNAYSFPLHI